MKSSLPFVTWANGMRYEKHSMLGIQSGLGQKRMRR